MYLKGIIQKASQGTYGVNHGFVSVAGRLCVAGHALAV
jgi:hypothetical protein